MNFKEILINLNNIGVIISEKQLQELNINTQILIYSALITVIHPSNQLFQFLKQKPQMTEQNQLKLYQYVSKELDAISFTAQDLQFSKDMNLTAIAYLLEKAIKIIGKEFISEEEYKQMQEQKKQEEFQRRSTVNYKVQQKSRVQNEQTYGIKSVQQQSKQKDQKKDNQQILSNDTEYLQYQLTYMENLYNKNQFLLKLISNRIGDLQLAIKEGVDILKEYEQEYGQNVKLSRNIEQLQHINDFTELYDIDMIDKQYEEYLVQLEQRKIELKQEIKENIQKQQEKDVEIV